MNKLKKAVIIIHFRRDTDPYLFCIVINLPCTKFHAFIIKCTILLKIVTYPPHYTEYDFERWLHTAVGPSLISL